jgi:hypothetical protein
LAFHLKREESVAHGLRRLAGKQLRSADRSLHSSRTSDVESIYEARRDLKKTRAILDILNEDHARGIGSARRRLRKVSRTLATFRDADACVEVFDRVLGRARRTVSARTLVLVRRRLVADQRALRDDRTLARKLRQAGRQVHTSRQSVDDWRPTHKRFAALGKAIATGLRDGRKAMNVARARGWSTDFHEWRKVVKQLWYELRLLEACGGRVRADARALDRIETWLGEDHNAAVMYAKLFEDDGLAAACPDLEKLGHVVTRYQATLRRRALARGTRLYANAPARYVAEVKRLWREWRDSPRSPATTK